MDADQLKSWLQNFPISQPIIIIPVFNAFEDVIECLESLKSTTAPLLVIDDASTDERIEQVISKLTYIGYIRKQKNTGFVASVNYAFELTHPHDVIVINSDVVLPENWLERLQRAAYSQPHVVTATPLTNHGAIVSIPYRNQPNENLPNGLKLDEIDKRIQRYSPKLYPVIPTCIGHCTYFKRIGLEITGYFDPIFAPGYGEEVDLSQRMSQCGFLHVVADDLFVFHKGSRSFGISEAKQRLQHEHEEIVFKRYPWYQKWVKEITEDEIGPLARTLEAAQKAVFGYSIAIDGSAIDGKTAGTQIATIELISALSRQLAGTPHRLSVILRDGVPKEILGGLEEEVAEIVYISKLTEQQFDLIHRTSQIWMGEELLWLQKASKKLVVTFLDAIFFSTPNYSSSVENWQEARQLARLTFELTDGMIFISQSSLNDTRQQGLYIPEERACITYMGVDHSLLGLENASSPAKIARLVGQPYLLLLGNDFRHKNRLFTIRLFDELIKQYSSEIQLVLAGAKMLNGGSSETEQDEAVSLLDSGRVIDLGPVSETEKKWLLKNANLVLYPSHYEGFGIVPFEAAAHGTPALTFASSAVKEVLGDKVYYLENFDVKEGAQLVWELLTNQGFRQTQLTAILEQANEFTWRKTAEETLNFYYKVLTLPSRRKTLSSIERFDDRIATISQEYAHLKDWADQLSDRLVKIEEKPAYRALTRLKLL